MAENSPAPWRPGWSAPLLVFLFFLGFYLFTAKGIIFITDGMLHFLTTEALAERRSLAIDCGIRRAYLEVAPDGRCYSKYDPGLPLTSLPLYLLARPWAQPLPPGSDTISLTELAVSTASQFITAATCALLYVLARQLGAAPRPALTLVFLFGLCTIAWPYSGLHVTQPLVGLALTLSVALLLAGRGRRPWLLLGAGLAAGWAVLTRLDAAPLALVLGLYLLARQPRPAGTAPAPWWSTGRDLALLWGPVAVAVTAYFWLNLVRSGTLLRLSYLGETWSTFFAEGLYGLLLSPGRGIIFYSPLAVLAVAGLPGLWRRGWRAETALIAGLFVTQLATYMTWWAWDGGWTWGPRFLVSTQPLLLLGLLPWLDERRPQWPTLLLATAGFLVQVIGVTTDTITYLVRTQFTYRQTLFAGPASPILGQLGQLLDRQVSLLLTSRAYGALTPAQTAVWALACLALMAAAGWRLRGLLILDGS